MYEDSSTPTKIPQSVRKRDNKVQKCQLKKIDIINQLKSFYTIRKNYFKIKINDPKSKTPNLRSLDDQIRRPKM